MTIASMENLAALAVGTRISVSGHHGGNAVFERTPANGWRPVTPLDIPNVSLDTTVFASSVGAGRITQVEPVTPTAPTVIPGFNGTTWTVGQQSRLTTDRQNMPLGSVLMCGSQRHIKVGVDLWCNSGGTYYASNTATYFYSDAYMSSQSVAYDFTFNPVTLAVGETIGLWGQRSQMPVGTTITLVDNPSRSWRKDADNRWLDTIGVGERTDEGSGWSSDQGEAYRIDSLPEGVSVVEPTQSAMWTTGATCTTDAERESMPLGSVLRASWAANPSIWVKVLPDLWLNPNGGGTRRNANNGENMWRTQERLEAEGRSYAYTFNTQIMQAEYHLGLYGQRSQMPVGSVIMHHADSDDTYAWTKEAPNRWTSPAQGRADREDEGHGWESNHLRYRIVLVPAAVEAPVGITEAEVERRIQEAVAAAIAGRNAAVYNTIVEAWDGTSFNQYEVNEVLDNLGLDNLPPEQESVEVTASVQMRTTVSDDHFIEGWLGAPSVGVEVPDYITVEYSIDVTLGSVTVNEGDCACDEYNADSVLAAVRDVIPNRDNMGEVTDYDKSCSNC